METRMMIKGFSPASLFKLLFIGTFFSVGLLIFGLGVASYLGYPTLGFTDQPLVGFKGLAVGVVAAPLFSGILSSILWFLIGFGLWLYTRFKRLEIYYREF